MAYKILVNHTDQPLKIDLLTRDGDWPENEGPTEQIELMPGQMERVEYGDPSSPFLNGVGVKVVDRGSPYDDMLNTNDTITFMGSYGELMIQASNS